ncbi:phytoene desaturase family protein [Nevskia ramosa]|uniref:phytoene desaturase family protein n=1 Tax=Nevskia ramosa TaxID=64002 RepID=UPI003D0F129C
MSQQYDVVVAGGGSNSLSAAAYLAKAGMSVCVLDKNPVIGGGLVNRELTEPGFQHEPHATGLIIVMANPMIKEDELGLKSKFGLRFFTPEKTIATVYDDETWMSTCVSLDKTCEAIAKFSQKDAETYRAFVTRVVMMAPLLKSAMFKPPIPYGQFAMMLDQSPLGQELLRGMMMSCSAIFDEMFESEKVKIHFMKWMGIFLLHPDARGTGLMFYTATAVAHTQEESGVYGGVQAFSDALGKCIEHHGGVIRTNTWVKKILVSGGKATGVELADGEQILAKKAVIGAIHPHLLGDMVAGLDPDMVAEAKRCELSSHTGVMTHWALHEAPKYKCPEVNDALLVQAVPSKLADMKQVFDDVGAGRLPTRLAAILAHMTVHDPSRAPAGKHTLYFFNFAPKVLKDGGWSHEAAERVREWMMQEYRKYTTNMGPENIIAGMSESPADQNEWSPSFAGGDFMGIGMFQHQLMGRRPTPRLAQYAVPGADGLYLTGPFMHPGGAITGGGRATAMKIMEDLGIDSSKHMSI